MCAYLYLHRRTCTWLMAFQVLSLTPHSGLRHACSKLSWRAIESDVLVQHTPNSTLNTPR
jgi:hypothetical protein